MFRIRFILIRIWIPDPYFLITDPDPTPDQDPTFFLSGKIINVFSS